MRKTLLPLFCLLFLSLSFSTINENLKPDHRYIHFDLTDKKFTARLNDKTTFSELPNFGSSDFFHYNFAENIGGENKKYLNEDSCILTYSNNKLNANWNTAK